MKKSVFISSFSFFILLLLLPMLFLWARIHTEVLNRNRNSRHLCLIPDLRWKSFNISQLNIMFAFLIWFLQMPFIKLRKLSSISTWLRFYMIKSWILSSSFITWHLLKWSFDFSLLLVWWIILINFGMLICPLIPRKSLFGDNTISYYILLIWFGTSFKKLFCNYVYERDLPLLLSCNVSVECWYEDYAGFRK